VDVLRRTPRKAQTFRGRMLQSDVLRRFARERVPTIGSASPNQIVKLAYCQGHVLTISIVKT
jgi:hypothetical protein